MLIEYNGVRLIMTDLIGYEREGVYSTDGADLLYVKHTVNCICYLAPTGYPQATSIELDAPQITGNGRLRATAGDLTSTNPARNPRGQNPTPYEFYDRETYGVQNVGSGVSGIARGDISNSAFITDAEVRMRLMVPRRKLKITAWRVAESAEGFEDTALTDFEEIIWLESPRAVEAPVTRVDPPPPLIPNGESADIPLVPPATQVTLNTPEAAPATPTTLETGGGGGSPRTGGGFTSGGSLVSVTPTPTVPSTLPARLVYPPCDAANGPLPLRVDVVEAAGNGTSMTVNFQISTCLVPVDPVAERLVLSHRWEIGHSHDENHYLTRTIVGEIVFNGGMFRQMELLPSDFLGQLMHPVPLGFERGVPQVAHSSDGLVIQYTVTDTDTTITFDPGNSGCTNISIVETIQYLQPSVFLGSRL